MPERHVLCFVPLHMHSKNTAHWLQIAVTWLSCGCMLPLDIQEPALADNCGKDMEQIHSVAVITHNLQMPAINHTTTRQCHNKCLASLEDEDVSTCWQSDRHYLHGNKPLGG